MASCQNPPLQHLVACCFAPTGVPPAGPRPAGALKRPLACSPSAASPTAGSRDALVAGDAISKLAQLLPVLHRGDDLSEDGVSQALHSVGEVEAVLRRLRSRREHLSTSLTGGRSLIV